MKQMTREEFDEAFGLTESGHTTWEVEIFHTFYVIGRKSVRW
jgi:hypothetical protein